MVDIGMHTKRERKALGSRGSLEKSRIFEKVFVLRKGLFGDHQHINL